VADLYFDEVADQTLTQLEPSSDRQDRALLNRLNAVFDQLAADPGDASVRARRFQSGLWLVTVAGRAGEDGCAVLWEPHVELPDDVMIHYVGSASFA
jgi:hypothetical protein